MPRYLSIAANLTVLMGCAAAGPVGPHTPVLVVKSSEVPTFPINGSVTIENVQSRDEPKDLDFRGIVVNLKECTQVLVDAEGRYSASIVLFWQLPILPARRILKYDRAHTGRSE